MCGFLAHFLMSLLTLKDFYSSQQWSDLAQSSLVIISKNFCKFSESYLVWISSVKLHRWKYLVLKWVVKAHKKVSYFPKAQ